jgi:xanthine dehydrogenase accessory factor
MIGLYQEAVARLTEGRKVAFAEIIEHQGSTPREEGAQMLVWLTDRGSFEIAGTIGGGRLEAEAIEKACSCLSTAQDGAVIDIDLSGIDAAETDMICGGSCTVMVTVLAGRDTETLKKAAESISLRQRAWLVTLWEGDNAHTAFVDGDRRIVCGDELTQEQSASVLDSIGPAMHTQDDEAVTIWARRLSAGPLLYVFGGGHVGLSTVLIGNHIGFDTIVIDDREAFVNEQRFPDSRCIVAGSPAELPELGIGVNDYIVIMSRGHLLDYDWLHWVLSLETMPKYVGMIGSRRKTAAIYERLKREGVANERIDQVVSPIGLAIDAQTPEEIAVSIAAQLVQVRNRDG